MLNIGLIHGFVGGGGGTEKTLLTIIDFLKEKKHNVTLYSFSKPSIPITGIKLKYILPFHLPFFGLYQRYYEKNLIKKTEKDDLIINASGGLVSSDNPLKQIVVYCHSDFQDELGKKISKYKGLWSLYYKPYSNFIKDIDNLIHNKNIHLITNSKFTHDSIKSRYSKSSTVIYPPVNLSEFMKNTSPKENQIVTVSRFSQEKNLEFILNVIKDFDGSFTIIGNTKTKSNKLYFDKLLAKINKDRIHHKVNLLKNTSRQKLVENLKMSKVYFHSSPETFGISVIEAIASKCIPIVPDDSAHVETVPFKQLRYRPNDVNDASIKIQNALEGKFDHLLDPLNKSIQQFDKENFKSNLENYLSNKLSIKL